MWSHVTDRYYAGKGEIMRRAIVGNSVGVRAAMMLVLALVVFIGAGPAMAQDPAFKTIGIDFEKFGSSTNKDAGGAIISASAILCASDVDNDVFKNGSDGKLDVSGDGAGTDAVGASNVSSASTVEILKTRMFSPIMANLESGDDLVLATLIEDITASIVTDLLNGPEDAASNTAMQEIISWVTADFSAGLFADHTATSVYSDISPTYATTTLGSEAFLKLAPSGLTHSSTTVIVFWEVPGMVVSATDSANTAQSYSATMALFGGDTALRVGKSNFVGVETGLNSAPAFDSDWQNDGMIGVAHTLGSLSWNSMIDKVNEEGTRPGVSIGIRVKNAVDTTTKPAYAPYIGTSTYDLDPQTYLTTVPVDVPFQFRLDDTMTIEMQLDVNETLDGEPDEYFGAGGSDSLELAADGKASTFVSGTRGSELIGSSLVITSENTSDGSIVLTNIQYDITNAIDGSNKLLDMTAGIKENVVTRGSYDTFTIKAVISDEVNSATEVSVNHYVDTAAPIITAIRARARDDASEGGDIGGSGSDADAIFGFEIDGNGESSQTTYVDKWLGMTIQSLSKNYVDATGTTAWNSDTFATRVNLADIPVIDYNATQSIAKSVLGTLIANIPNGTILGASVTIRIQNNVSTTINSGGLIVSVSDDARNMAVVYAGTDGSGQAALIDTTEKWYSIADFSPLIANTLNPATVEIDNHAPTITNAWVSVSGLPTGYSNGGIDTSAAFELLRTSYETVGAAITTYPGDVNQVIRGTAAMNNAGLNNDQAGSPLRLVIQFNPSSNSDDTDSIPWTASTTAQNVAAMDARYDVQITSANLGYAIDGNGDNVDYLTESRWDLADATIVVINNNYAAAVGWATFYDTVGIPKADSDADNTLPWNELSSEALNVSLADRAGNVVAQNTVNGIIVDTRKIDIIATPFSDGNQARAATLKQADDGNTSAPTLLAIVDTAGTELTGAEKLNYSISAAITNAAVKNSSTLAVAGATAVELRAGYTIIVGANFQETDGGALGGTDIYFNQIDDDTTNTTTITAGFPFLIDNQTIVASQYIDANGSAYGTVFRTLSADFSDIIDSAAASDVLPDVTVVAAGGAGIGTAVPGDIVSATWFFYISGAESLKLSSAGDIRQVTLAARDLSGNVSRYEIKVGTASFAKPLVTVLDYEINNINRGISRAVIQRDSSYLGGANVAAISLSQATMNIDNATIMLVAKIGNGTNKGGPFTPNNFIYANLSSIGGGATAAPTLVTDANGVAISLTGGGSSVGPADIIYATWVTGSFNSSDSGGAANAKISVHAIASSGGVGDSDDATGIQVDHTMGAITTSDITEENADGRSTAFTGDVGGDGIVRPNQTVTVTGYFTMDAADIANPSLIQFDHDLSQLSSSINPTAYTWSGVNTTVRGVTYEFKIPGDTTSGFYKAIVHATDAAGNDNLDESNNFVTVNSTKPQVQSIVVAASSVINFATDSVGLIAAWREIGTRDLGDPANPEILESTTLVRGGDILWVSAVIKINDDVFSDLDVTADFSEFSGSAYKAVVPVAYSDVSDYRIMQGTRVAGNIYYATWIHAIPAGSGASVIDASVRIDVVNPAGTAAEGPSIYSVPMNSDNAGPEISALITYSKKGVPQTGEINPNAIITKGTANSLQVGDATALIVVSATYADADTNRGYASSILSSLFFNSKASLDSVSKEAQDVLFDLNTQGLTDDSDPEATYFAFSDKTGVYSDSGSSGDGPVITSASSFLNADSIYAAQLKNATDSVLNVWYGFDPKANSSVEALVIKDDAAKDDAVLTFSAMDSIGNKTNQNTSTTIEIDGQAPIISIGKAGNVPGATMTIAPGQTAWVDYVPALYSGAIMVRPTRVSNGTIVRVNFHLWDEPDRDDAILLSIDGTDLAAKASTFTIYSPTAGERTDQSAKSDYVFQTLIDPSQINGDSVDVSLDIPINWEQKTSNNSGTTLPLVLTSVADAVNYNDYKTAMDAKITNAGAGDNSSIIIDATDTIDNWNYQATAILGFEIDTEGPGVVKKGTVVQEKTFFVNTLAEVNNLTVPVNPDINAKAGSWLVWAATLVVDGTEDANFPLDNFAINWKEIFELDTDRLEDSTLIKGKTLIADASASSSILFVT
jgi:hypothetical protein